MEAITTLQAQSKKKVKTGAIVGIASALAALTGVYFVFIRKNDEGITLWGKWTGGAADKIEDIEQPSDTPPAGVTKWINESFPLKKGMFGGYTKLLQKKLGISADGKFGSGTESAVYKKFGKNEVDKTAYDNFINPPATGGGANFADLKKALTGYKNISGGIQFFVQGKNVNYWFNFYTNGRYAIYEGATTQVKKGTYSDGGKTMKNDGDWTSYTKGSALLNMKAIVNDLGK